MDKPLSKQSLYSMVSCKSKVLIYKLFELSQSENENIALGACKVLLNKTIPDLRSHNLDLQSDTNLKIEIISEKTDGSI